MRDGGAEGEHSGVEARTLAHSLTLSVRTYRNKGIRLPTHVSETAANSQDCSCLEFVAAPVAREGNIQNTRGGGL